MRKFLKRCESFLLRFFRLLKYVIIIMTFKELQDIITRNNIPENVTLMSDSGWECDATDMDGVFYNRKSNIIVFTQDPYYEYEYLENSDWELLNFKEKQKI